MAITFTQEKKKQRYLLVVLGVIVLSILAVIWWSFSGREAPQPMASQIVSFPAVDINFDILRKTLDVTSPYLSVSLAVNKAFVFIEQEIDLTASIAGVTDSGVFTYRFDCQDDGEYEFVVEYIAEKTQTAVCEYQKAGTYTAKVTAESQILDQIKSVTEVAKILVKEPNINPVISSCDVIPSSGSVSSKFNFTASASDPDGDSLSFVWDFDDGDFADTLDAVHQYKKTGAYSPFVKVSDLDGAGKIKGGEARCYPSSILPLSEFKGFKEIPFFEGTIGRNNPFIPY